MLLIRKVKSKSGSTVVQVGSYVNRKFKLHKHIGSARNSQELQSLLDLASCEIESDKEKSCKPLFAKNETETANRYFDEYLNNNLKLSI